MATLLPADVLQDDLAVSLARVLATANRQAIESGIDIPQSLITITQYSVKGNTTWQIHYGPQDYVGRRGGDLMVEVDPADASVKRVLRGQ